PHVERERAGLPTFDLLELEDDEAVLRVRHAVLQAFAGVLARQPDQLVAFDQVARLALADRERRAEHVDGAGRKEPDGDDRKQACDGLLVTGRHPRSSGRRVRWPASRAGVRKRSPAEATPAWPQ